MSLSLATHRAIVRVGALYLALMLAACATWHEPSEADDKPLREREVSAASHGVRVSATVLGSEDSTRIYGADINRTGVQPLWVEVQNGTSQALWL
jgi:hypothetical protein